MAKQVTQTGGQAGWMPDAFSGSRSWHGVSEGSLPGGIAPGTAPRAGQEREHWLQRDSHLDSPLLQLLRNLKSFNFPPPRDCSPSPLHHTRKYFAFSSAECKADVSTWKGKILTNPEGNCVHGLACALGATISNNLPAHSGAERKAAVFLPPLAVQRGKNHTGLDRKVFTNTYEQATS